MYISTDAFIVACNLLIRSRDGFAGDATHAYLLSQFCKSKGLLWSVRGLLHYWYHEHKGIHKD